MNVFISGISSGLGQAISQQLLQSGDHIWAIGRRAPEVEQGQILFQPCDLKDLNQVSSTVENLLNGVTHLDLVILNAGVIGPLRPMVECPIGDIKDVMDINVWANKILLDTILQNREVRQVITISSGASQSGSLGWNSYSLSKATLNMLTKLYAGEFPKTHFTALAPGLVKTPMLNHLLDNEPVEQFPSLQRLHDSKKQTPQEAAENILRLLPQLKEFDSGGFQDVRKLIGEKAF